MSLITQCPACATMFRVVPDQLRISEGWVRCGQCDEVFDANAHMQSQDAPVVVSAPEVRLPPEATYSPGDISDPLDPASSINVGYDWGAIAEPQVHLSAEEPIANQGEELHHVGDEPSSTPEDVLNEEPPAEVEPYLEPSHFDLPVMEDSLASQYVPPMEDNWQHAPESSVDVSEEDAPASAEEVPLSFMPREERTSRLGRIFGKRMMAAICCLLALMLGLQLLVAERDRVAAIIPSSRSVLVAACGVLGCVVSAPRQIESIAIDSSAFTSIKPGIYLLNVTLKNAATLALASPALELTLTDMQDKPLLRRVILAEEFAGKTPVMEAGAELSSSIPVAVRAGTGIENIAGYKLLAFYP